MSFYICSFDFKVKVWKKWRGFKILIQITRENENPTRFYLNSKKY